MGAERKGSQPGPQAASRGMCLGVGSGLRQGGRLVACRTDRAGGQLSREPTLAALPPGTP